MTDSLFQNTAEEVSTNNYAFSDDESNQNYLETFTSGHPSFSPALTDYSNSDFDKDSISYSYEDYEEDEAHHIPQHLKMTAPPQSSSFIDHEVVEKQRVRIRLEFVSRLTSIPLVSSGVNTINNFYDSSKKSSKYVGYALDKVESTVSNVSKPLFAMTEPYQMKYQAQIHTLDSFATKQLDRLEDKFPIVKEPTEKVLESSKQIPSQVIETCKNSLEKNINVPAHSLVKDIEQKVGKTFENYVDAAAFTVEKYLGSEVGSLKENGYSSSVDQSKENGSVTNDIIAESENSTASVQKSSVVRAFELGAGVPRLLTRKVIKQIKNVHIPHSSEEATKYTGELLHQATERIRSSYNALVDTLSHVKENTIIAKDSAVDSLHQRYGQLHIQQILRYLSSKLLSDLTSVAEFAKSLSPSLPPTLQQHLIPALDYFSSRYYVVAAAATNSNMSVKERALNVVKLTAESLPLLETAKKYFELYGTPMIDTTTIKFNEMRVGLERKVHEFGIVVQ